MKLTFSPSTRGRPAEWRFTITKADWDRAVMDPVHLALMEANRESTKISEILAALAMLAAGVEKADAAGDHTSEISEIFTALAILAPGVKKVDAGDHTSEISEILAALGKLTAGVEKADAGDHTSE